MPEQILIEEAAAEAPLTNKIITRCRGIPYRIISDVRKEIQQRREIAADPFEKATLLLCRNRGRFLEPCPGTRGYICCGYMVLTPGIGCPLDCSYCVLQAYLNNPFVTLYVNTDDMVAELETMPEGIVRIGTGEFMDSLALDHLTDFSTTMLPVIRRKPDVVLELKTKTDNIDNLVNLDHNGAYIVSWSLNTETAAQHEELGAAPLTARIEAARKLVACGYRVGFHFDPLIMYPGCEQEYYEVIGMLERHIPADSVAWISIGSLRYMPNLKKIAQHRFPETKIFTGEFVPGRDGKMRYLQQLRIAFYEGIVARLRAWSPDLCIYFCMENGTVWQKVFGFVPGTRCSSVKEMLDRRTGRQ